VKVLSELAACSRARHQLHDHGLTGGHSQCEHAAGSDGQSNDVDDLCGSRKYQAGGDSGDQEEPQAIPQKDRFPTDSVDQDTSYQRAKEERHHSQTYSCPYV